MKSIGNYAFFYCTNLITVSIPDGVTKIEYSTFDNCCSLTSVDIPSSVKSIGNNAFIDCCSLTSVDIPSNVTEIKAHAFQGGRSLKEINFQGTTPPSFDNSAFTDIASDAVFIVPDEALESYKTVLGEVNLCNFSNYQTDAISAVKAAMGEDKESPYLNNLVKTEVEAIGAAETYSAIRTARDEALKKISTVIEAFQASKSEILGTKQNGPAVKVTYGGKTVISYNPDTVEYIIVNE